MRRKLFCGKNWIF